MTASTLKKKNVGLWRHVYNHVFHDIEIQGDIHSFKMPEKAKKAIAHNAALSLIHI